MVENLTGIEDADDLMLDIIERLSEGVTPVPDLGNWYTFIYKAKTPNITYDTKPLVAEQNTCQVDSKVTTFIGIK